MARFNFILLLIVMGCALSAVNSNHRARKLYIELEAEQKRMHELDVEWGQLQLEQSTQASHSRIEKIAREKLGMKPPAPGQIISIDSDSVKEGARASANHGGKR